MLSSRHQLLQGLHLVRQRGLCLRCGGRVRGATKRCAHHHHALKDIRVHQGAPSRHWGAEIVTDHSMDLGVAERLYECQHIADQIRHVAGAPVAFIAVIAAGASAIASLVWCHHMETCLREGRELMPPTVGEFWKAVKQKQQRFAGTAGGDLSGLQQVHLQAG